MKEAKRELKEAYERPVLTKEGFLKDITQRTTVD
jgi:hypothetical protein